MDPELDLFDNCRPRSHPEDFGDGDDRHIPWLGVVLSYYAQEVRTGFRNIDYPECFGREPAEVRLDKRIIHIHKLTPV